MEGNTKNMLLNNVLSRRNAAKILLFEGSSELSAKPFLKRILHDENARADVTHMICFQQPTQNYNILFADRSNVTYYDVFSDPLGWNATDNGPSNEIIFSVNTDLPSLIKKRINSHTESSANITIVIDGLSMLLRHKTISEVCRMVNSLSIDFEKVSLSQVIVLAEKDVVSDVAISALEYIADCSIRLEVANQSKDRARRKGKDNQIKYQTDVTLKKKSGRVIREVGVYSFSNNGELIKLKDVSLAPTNENEIDEADPTANLTFNLKLTESEKKARSNVKLPYMLDQEQKAAHLDASAGSGKIIYHHDDADDFDEEDPDDDLDI